MDQYEREKRDLFDGRHDEGAGAGIRLRSSRWDCTMGRGMSGTKKVKDLTVGSSVDSTFLVMEKELREFVTKEGYYLQLKLADSTGSIWAKCWEEAEEVASLLEPGDIVRIKGVVESFRGRLQLIFEPDGVARASGTYDMTDYMPRTLKDIDGLTAELVKKVGSIANDYLKRIVWAFLRDPVFLKAFTSAPSAKIHHHNYRGGLLEHTHAVTTLCETIALLYPELDRDLLLAGALLHDIGKTATYDYAFRIAVTEEGGLIDHIVLGYQMVEERLNEIEGFPEEIRLKLLHLILSHHNYGEWGSPVKPMFAEAEALCYADMLDAQLKEFQQLQTYESLKEKDGVWSDFNSRLGQFFYLGRGKGDSKGRERRDEDGRTH
ncbi:MAG: HD domain-containing protein [Methanophagales archaeon ANME-1-THS]|nr:MAG: HD domain-containing protein [Methanophagales archaeon ANME-1-THS]